MKVTAWRNVDVECVVDVSLDDCINEMLSEADEDGRPRAKLGAINGATKVMEKVTPEMVGEFLAKNPSVIDVIGERLAKWIDAVRASQRVGN
jgi:hypothetical protein